jgi:hypothetical protein
MRGTAKSPTTADFIQKQECELTRPYILIASVDGPNYNRLKQGKNMPRRLRLFLTAAIASSAFLFVSAAPSTFAPFGNEPALAKGKGSGKGSSKKKSSGKSGSKGKSSSSQGKSSSAPGQGTGVASASAAVPKSIVRQYVLENGLKQGDVASQLKSWNSLNRNEQAYLNNMDNPNSLPGRQIAYIRDKIAAEGALAGFIATGGDPLDPPSEDEVNTAQAEADLLADQYDAWTAYQDALDFDSANPDLANPELTASLGAEWDAISGGLTEGPSEDDALAAQTQADQLATQYDAWTDYEAAKTAAQDAFVGASVSYNGTPYDEETYGPLREQVDGIIALKGLDTMVTEYDAAAAEGEPSEPDAPVIE